MPARQGREEEEKMKVQVDQVKCGTIGFCVKICPEVFRFHPGSKKAYAMMPEVPSHLQARCTEAAQRCPNNAIIISY
jgi:ferredoxin